MSGVGEHRLKQLEVIKPELQFGTGFQVNAVVGGQITNLAANLIRFVGEKSDVNNWRVYLSPWGLAPGQQAGLFAGRVYAVPTPWAGAGTPAVFDNFFDDNIYARVRWGAGGVQHEAYVDWPKRGCLFQVGGSYLQVDAVCTGITAFGPPPLNAGHPFLQASLAIEPGGGDSDSPGTFTYRRQPPQVAPDAWLFQIPPFARTFRVLADQSGLALAGIGTAYTIEEVSKPTGQILQSFLWTPGGVPADLMQDNVQLTGAGSDVRITMINPTGSGLDDMGLLFSLDL